MKTSDPKYFELKTGMKLRCDDRFDCIASGTVLEVYHDTDFGFCVRCDYGDHLLERNLGFDDDTIIDFDLVHEDQPPPHTSSESHSP